MNEHVAWWCVVYVSAVLLVRFSMQHKSVMYAVHGVLFLNQSLALPADIVACAAGSAVLLSCLLTTNMQAAQLHWCRWANEMQLLLY
jgi:hypothetical protein